VVDNSVLTFTKETKDEEAAVNFENKTNLSNYSKLKFDINDLASVRRIYPGHGIPSIVFELNDGQSWPPLYFYKGFLLEIIF